MVLDGLDNKAKSVANEASVLSIYLEHDYCLTLPRVLQQISSSSSQYPTAALRFTEAKALASRMAAELLLHLNEHICCTKT